jgi:ribA/ribD-fused uncharacterized protein
MFTRKPAAPHIVSPNIEPFRGGKHPPSNYFPVDISVEDVSYPTAEHYYQHAKAMSLGLPDEADEVLYADTLYKAMTLGNDLDNLVSAAEITLWHDQRVEVMRRTLDLKYHASPEFREPLVSTCVLRTSHWWKPLATHSGRLVSLLLRHSEYLPLYGLVETSWDYC